MAVRPVQDRFKGLTHKKIRRKPAADFLSDILKKAT
jgi:hypothetical protein